MRQYYTLTSTDVGKANLHIFGKVWPVSSFLGQVLDLDVGKKVYLVGGILQVENNEQRTQREDKP